MKRTILLTGANGYLGSQLLESLVIHDDYDLVILKRSASDTTLINHLLSKLRVYDIDSISFDRIFSLEKVDIIINTVCLYGKSNESTIEIINANLIFGIQLLEAALINNVKTFINADSMLPRNLNYYSLSKAQFSDWLYHFSEKIQVVNVKIELMYGPKDSKNKFVSWLINEMVNKDQDILLTSGLQKRDFIFISDVVAAFNTILNNISGFPKWSQFEVGSNELTEIREFVLSLAQELEKRYKKDIVSRLKFGEIEYRKGEVMVPTIDNTELVNLGWRSKVSIKDGILQIINH